MRPSSLSTALLVTGAFVIGFLFHLLYQRWTVPNSGNRLHPVAFSPLASPGPKPVALPLLEAREVEKIRQLAGSHARVRGRVFRVGHSAKSDTYFINFGPSRSSFTGVIFASSLEKFAARKFHPKDFEGRELELTGEIKDHPQYGLEMILEDPAQVKVLD